MGKLNKKRPVKVQDASLQSAPVNTNTEFEGLCSFEEISDCTFMKVNKYGKVKHEIWKDGKIRKKKNRKKKGKILIHKDKVDVKTGSKINLKKSSVGSHLEISKDNGDLESLKIKAKKQKRKCQGEPKPQGKKARYDNASYIGDGSDDKKNVDVSAWDGLFVPSPVLKALSALGFSMPTEIQRLVLPAAIHGQKDIIGAAETGSGKTLAFGIPIIHGILRDKEKEALAPSTVEEKETVAPGINVEETDGELSSEEANSGDNIVSSGYVDSESEDINDEEKDLYGYQSDDDEDANPFIFNSDHEDDSDDENGDVVKKKNDKNFGCVKVIENVDFDFMGDGIETVSASNVPGFTDDGIEILPVSNAPVLKKPLRALIVTPTRELAIQVKSHLSAVLVYTDIKLAVVVGGLASEKQARILKRGPDIVVGTPGRLWELIEKGNEHLSQIPTIKYLAIDETDRMVEKGHFEELHRLLEIINNNESGRAYRQNFVFSATLTMVYTLPKRVQMKSKNEQLSSEVKVKKLAKLIGLKPKPKIVDVTRKFGTAESLTESRINCHVQEKDSYLYYFLKQYPGRTLVFCNSIDCVRRLQKLFTLLHCQPMSLHASMHQKQRLKSLEKFSSSSRALMLATDVAARGLDIPNIQHVIHYQTPRTAESYVHRSGRTARACQEGLSVLFIDPTEISKYRQLCNTLNRSTDLPPFPVDASIMEQVNTRLALARKLESLEHAQRKAKAQESWFKKAAQEAELYVDDSDEDDDSDEASERAMQDAKAKRDVKNMRMQLMQLLATPFISSDFSGKYPTKSGSLIMPIENRHNTVSISNTDNAALTVMKKESADYSNLVKTVKIKPIVDKKKIKKLKSLKKWKLKKQRKKEKAMKE